MDATETITTPDVDTDLLLTHLEYANWAIKTTFAMTDKIPTEALTAPVNSSFPSIVRTYSHIYQWNKYYLIHLQGDSININEVEAPLTYPGLKKELPRLNQELHAWALENLPESKNINLTGWAVWPVWMVVMQIANHTTHHLGQILTLVRQAGYVPLQSDWTDLILYYLKRYPQKAANKS